MESKLLPAQSCEGFVAAGYERVAESFVDALTRGNDIGGTCALYVGGKLKVQVWRGRTTADNSSNANLWRENTLMNVYSVSKAVTNVAVAHLVSRGLCQFEDRVAQHWPEFGVNGKEQITISQLLSHQAGLSYFDEGSISMDIIPSCGDSNSPKRLEFASMLARQKPKWELQENRSGYHPHTVGFFVSELVRRIDPKGRCVSAYFKEELSGPHSLDIHIGVHEGDVSVTSRLSRVFPPPKDQIDEVTRQAMAHPNPLSMHSFRAIAQFTPWKGRFMEIPSSVGFSDARSIARLMSVIANGGADISDGEKSSRLLDEKTIQTLCRPLPQTNDLVLREQRQYTAGGLFWGRLLEGLSGDNKTTNYDKLSLTNQIVFHRGHGGPLAYADLTLHIGFSVITNSQRLNSDDQYRTILNTVYDAVLNDKSKL